jgi:hypothetical protein
MIAMARRRLAARDRLHRPVFGRFADHPSGTREPAAAKGFGEGHRFGIARVQLNSAVGRFLMLSAMQSASAWIVDVGFTPPEVTQMRPSTIKRFLTSW